MDKNLNSFLSDHYVRTTWIAFFTLWVLWGLVYVVRHAFVADDNEIKTVAATAPQDPETAATKHESKFWNPSTSPIASRIIHVNRILHENTMLLLSVLVLNTFGNASTRAVMILTWIYFAFTVVFAFSELVYGNRFVRVGYNIIFYALTLAIGGLAFAQGW
ncbi:hypothetical protein K492DRAFT_137172 [Lichtheimia hyalospora FSU 10163]|nr:hypothetical protein K492DRAFT_137172 [Lichtheimia hyalospora FSU 10163]